MIWGWGWKKIFKKIEKKIISKAVLQEKIDFRKSSPGKKKLPSHPQGKINFKGRFSGKKNFLVTPRKK